MLLNVHTLYTQKNLFNFFEVIRFKFYIMPQLRWKLVAYHFSRTVKYNMRKICSFRIASDKRYGNLLFGKWIKITFEQFSDASSHWSFKVVKRLISFWSQLLYGITGQDQSFWYFIKNWVDWISFVWLYLCFAATFWRYSKTRDE